MSVLATDFLKGFDPTGSATLSAAQLLQLINSATPQTDKGLVIVTADAGGSPDVPDAATTTKWQKYLWLRVVTASSTFTLYAWNPNVGSDATYLKWKDTYSGTIPAGSITNDMLAGSIAASKLAGSIALSQITNGTNLLSTTTSFATGDVTGTQSGGLVIGAKKVLSTMLANDATTDANRAVTTNSIKDAAVTLVKFDITGAIDTFLNNTVANTPAWATKPSIIKSGSAVVTTSNAGKVPQVLTAAAGDAGTWTMVDPTTLGRVLQIRKVYSAAVDSATAASYAFSPTAVPISGTTAKLSTGLLFNFTPVSASSTLFIEVLTNIAHSSGTTTAGIALFISAGAGNSTSAIAANSTDIQASVRINPVSLVYSVGSGSLSARTYQVGFGGVAGTTYLNSVDGSTIPFGGTLGVNSYISITEYI